MDFQDLVSAQAVVSGLSVSNKKQLFQKLSEFAKKAYGLDSGVVYDRLMERERLGSTGFGDGIAIPHAKIDGLNRVYGLLVKLDHPIPFESIDDTPVDVIFSLLSPMDGGAEHLKMLARVSRYLRSGANVSRLRGAGSDEALLALLIDTETRDAA
jgi:nitrogen PTS system EIIA component